MNNAIFIALVLASGSVALNIILFIKFAALTKEIHGIGIHYGNLLKTADDQVRISENGNAIVKNIHETYQTMAKLQSRINEQYDRMFEQYDRILDQYKHLAEAFKLSEERYSDIYDQWSEMTARFEEIGTKIDELKPPKEFFNTDAEESLEVCEINSRYKEGA